MNALTTMEQSLENTRTQLSSMSIGQNHVTLNKVVLPIIRRMMPSVMAQQIVGVQPMTGAIAIPIPPPRAKAWCAKGMWVMFDGSLRKMHQKIFDEWCDANVETYIPDDDCYFFETAEDALMFWLRFG